MKKNVKLIIVMILVLCLTTALLVSCKNDPDPGTPCTGCANLTCSCVVPHKVIGAEDKTTILYLGDSISEGIAGPSPVLLREEFMFASLVAQRNGYQYYNHAISGHRSEQMLEFVKREDDGARMIATKMRTADIIHVSMLGNDLLMTMSLDTFLLEELQGKDDALNEILDQAYDNMLEIVDIIRGRMKKDATLIFQKVYNPVYHGTPLVDKDLHEALLAGTNYKGVNYGQYSVDDIRVVAHNILSRLNGILDDILLLDGYEDAYLIVDAQTASGGADGTGGWYEEFGGAMGFDQVITRDGIHPSNLGHALIADLIQEVLEENGLACPNALATEKIVRERTLKTYYKGIDGFNVDALIANIKAETTGSIGAVTRLLFDAADGIGGRVPPTVFPNYKDGPLNPDRHPSVAGRFDAKYKLSRESFIGMIDFSVTDDPNNHALSKMLLAILLDYDASYIEFKSDGTMTMNVFLEEDLFKNIGKLFSNSIVAGLMGGGSPEDYLQSVGMETFFYALFPEFLTDDIMPTFDLMGNIMGLSIIGLDAAGRTTFGNLFKGIFDGTLDLGSISIPGQLGIQLKGAYYVETYTSSVTEKTYTAICLGNCLENGNPYVMMTKDKDARGDDRVSFYFDIVGIYLEFLGD